MDRKEAIEKVRQMTLPKEMMEILEVLAPELRESEDERIRKHLVEIVETYWGTTNDPGKAADLAYLEKQKKQSMSATEVLVRAGLKPYKDGNQWCVLAGDNIQEGICGFGDTIDEALYQFLMEVLEKQKEQKPVEPNWIHHKVDLSNCSEEYIKAYYDGWNNCNQQHLQHDAEQKPAEWGKNDTAFLNEITDFFENKTVRLQHDLDMYAHWLKSLPERFNLQPKNEWSEADEEMLKMILGDLEWERRNTVVDKDIKLYDEKIAWLKSLRPVSKESLQSWKPSEEQMEALEYVIRDYREDSCNATANYLQEILDHLKNM